jgi:DNA-binding transcriptional LysR family regulator
MKNYRYDLWLDEQTGFTTWEAWLKKAGLTHIAATRGMKINNSAAVLQAVIEGQGVALARNLGIHGCSALSTPPQEVAKYRRWPSELQGNLRSL